METEEAVEVLETLVETEEAVEALENPTGTNKVMTTQVETMQEETNLLQVKNLTTGLRLNDIFYKLQFQ